MRLSSILDAVRNQRGVALPLALLVLLILAAVTAALLAMGATEPLIASNLKWGDQAFGIAEAGVERVRWALDNPAAAASGLANPLPGPVPAPYAGNTLVALGQGAYQMAVAQPCVAFPCAPGVTPGDRNVTVIGYAVRNSAPVPGAPPIPDPDIAGRRQIQVTLQTLIGGLVDPPGALTVHGTVDMTGNSSVDGTTSICGPKAGVSVTTGNTISVGGSATTAGTPAQQTITQAQFDAIDFTADQIVTLREIAKRLGPANYIVPTSNGQFGLTLTDGLMFVDTVNAQPLSEPFDPNVDTNKLASVRINGGNNSGWLIVMGTIRIDGNVSYRGLIYALNDFNYHGTGTGGIDGAVLSKNVRDTVSTVVDTNANGNSNIRYDCDAVKNGNGSIPPGFFVKTGTWREVTN